MTGQKNEILTRLESRHSSRPDVFYFFATAHFLKTIFCHRTNGTFAFAPTHEANPSAKSKEPFFCKAPIKTVFLTNYFMTSK